jgi:mxaK protein
MKRRTWHLLFGATALACAAAVLVNGLRLQQAVTLNRAVAAAREPAAGLAPADDAPREVRLARAIALADAGAYDAAFKAYGALISLGPLDAVGRRALYDLGNMHLRQGAADPGSALAMPMLELAKQRYRDLLRVAPDDWDARYNLELALRLAPETSGPQTADDNGPAERRSQRLRDFSTADLP